MREEQQRKKRHTICARVRSLSKTTFHAFNWVTPGARIYHETETHMLLHEYTVYVHTKTMCVCTKTGTSLSLPEQMPTTRCQYSAI